jgi:hypothetical protein
MAPECSAIIKLKKEFGDNVKIDFREDRDPNALLKYRERMTQFQVLTHRKHKRWAFNLLTGKWENYDLKQAVIDRRTRNYSF